MPVIVAPYLQRAQFERERPFIVGEALQNLGTNLAQTLFAYHQLHDKEMHDKIETISMLGSELGWNRIGQPALNERANAIDSVYGKKIYPRDLEGNALPPLPTEEQILRESLEGLSPEDKQKVIREKIGLGKVAREEHKMKISEDHQAYMEHLAEMKYDLLRLKEHTPKGDDQDSGRIWDAQKQGFRNTEPGETGLTFRQKRAWFAENKITIDSLNAKEKVEKIKYWKRKTHESHFLNDAQLGTMIKGYDKIKDPGLRAVTRSLITKSAHAHGIDVPEEEGRFARWNRQLSAAWNSIGLGGGFGAPATAAGPTTTAVPEGTTGAPAIRKRRLSSGLEVEESTSP